MKEVSFCDGLPYCFVNGHDMVITRKWKQRQKHYWTEFKVCSVCKCVEKRSKYKWMPERIDKYDNL